MDAHKPAPPRYRFLCLVGLVVAAVVIGAAASGVTRAEGPRPLKIYFLDMRGGASTLIVTPPGESVLIDTGSDNDDAQRILAAAGRAGLKQIDILVITHFHSDHFGGVLPLTKGIPVKKILDKGHLPPDWEQRTKQFQTLYAQYQEATGGKTQRLQAGDDIPLKNDPQGPPLQLHCVAAQRQIEGFAGDVDARIPSENIRDRDPSDNANSIALVLHYGKFRFFAGGDLTWNVEYHLARPRNVVGEVDLFQVTHHGLDLSNNPVLLAALNPTVCIAMNGPKKGIQPQTFRSLKQLPSVKAIYQIHYNQQYGEAGNAPGEFIANGTGSGTGGFFCVTVSPDTTSFTVKVGSDGAERQYQVK